MASAADRRRYLDMDLAYRLALAAGFILVAIIIAIVQLGRALVGASIAAARQVRHAAGGFGHHRRKSPGVRPSANGSAAG